ncbi:MAG: transposase, partial [Candidatus Omnitrophica bacterium]|nr:transposase [Candidatus Omnitrophota bacterium]
MILYHDCVKGMRNIFDLRLRMVEYAKHHGVSAAKREFKTTRDTVRKWKERYEKEGLSGLKDKPRRPKRSPKKIPMDVEVRLLELRKRHPRWGPLRLGDHYDDIPSNGACYRVWHENPDCMKPKRKKWQKQKDLRELKKRMLAFEKSQVDTKDLNDILHYWPQKHRLGLPRYQYTLREMSSGASFFAYADDNNSTNAARFAHYVLNHLANTGVNISGCEFQDDNGSEFIGSVRKKSKRPTAFQQALIDYNVKQGRIPPRSPTWNSDVEAFHRLCEEEFYDSEDFGCEDNFLAKAFSYQIWFNFLRKNRWRDSLAPWEILKQKSPKFCKEALLLPPIRLESLPLPNELISPQGV